MNVDCIVHIIWSWMYIIRNVFTLKLFGTLENLRIVGDVVEMLKL